MTYNRNEDKDGRQHCLVSLTENETESDLQDNEEKKVPPSDVDLIPKDTGWAWMCCLGCFLQNAITVGGIVKPFGILYVAFMQHFESRAGSAAWILGIANFSLLAGSSFTNALAMRFGTRIVVFFGGIVVSIGYITSMFATKIEHLYLTYGLTAGIGCSMAWSTSVTHMGQYFKHRRAIANGIAMSGVGIGQLIFSPILRLLLDNYGLKGALLIMAGVSLHVCVAATLMRPASAYRCKSKQETNVIYKKYNRDYVIKHNHDSEVKVVSRRKKTSTLNICKNICEICASLEWSLLKEVPYLLHGIAMFLYFAGFPTYFLMTPSHAEEIGHSSSSAAFLVSLCGVSELVGRLAAGFVADLRIIPSSILMAVMFFVGAVSSVITPFIKDYIPLAVLSFVYAMFIGPVMVMNPVIIAENFGVEKLSSGLGIMGLFMGAGMICSGPIAGTLRDVTGNWKASYYYCGSTLVLATVVMILSQFNLTRNKDKISHKHYQIETQDINQ